MLYKNISYTKLTINGEQFLPGEVKDVSFSINSPSFIRVGSMNKVVSTQKIKQTNAIKSSKSKSSALVTAKSAEIEETKDTEISSKEGI